MINQISNITRNERRHATTQSSFLSLPLAVLPLLRTQQKHKKNPIVLHGQNLNRTDISLLIAYAIPWCGGMFNGADSDNSKTLIAILANDARVCAKEASEKPAHVY